MGGGASAPASNKSDQTDRSHNSKDVSLHRRRTYIPFLDTKNSNNIDELFSQLAKTLLESHIDKKPRSHGGVVALYLFRPRL